MASPTPPSRADTPPVYPDPRTAFSLTPATFPAYLDALAAPSLFNLAHPSARARLFCALYSWAIDPSSEVRQSFVPASPDHPSTVNVADEWSLSATQQQLLADHSTQHDDDEYAPTRRGKPCGHVFTAGESVYRCRDCGLDPTCVLCARCFHASSHARLGHDVTVSTHAGVGAGCCDCGDEEAWKEGCQRDCKYHGTEGGAEAVAAGDKGKARAMDDDAEGPSEQAQEQDPHAAARAEAAKHRVAAHLRVALDWALDVFERAPETFSPPSSVDELLGLAPPASSSSAAAAQPAPAPGMPGGIPTAMLRQILRQAQARLVAEFEGDRQGGAAGAPDAGNATGMGQDEDEDVGINDLLAVDPLFVAGVGAAGAGAEDGFGLFPPGAADDGDDAAAEGADDFGDAERELEQLIAQGAAEVYEHGEGAGEGEGEFEALEDDEENDRNLHEHEGSAALSRAGEPVQPIAVEDALPGVLASPLPAGGAPPPPAPALAPLAPAPAPRAAASTSLPGAYPSPSPSSSTSSAPPPAAAAAAAQGPWSVILWNDERHSFPDVIDQVTRAVGCSRRAAADVARRVDSVGRDVVLVTADPAEAVRAARKVAEIELAVTVRPAREAWREQVAAEIVGPWVRDLMRVSLPGGGGGKGALGETVARVWAERDPNRGGRSRWQRLGEVEARLWKRVRKDVQEGAVGLMGLGGAVRREIGLQYAEIYPTLAQTYLLTDREPENSLIFFGVQVFTVPSLAALLLSRHYFLQQLLKLLRAFFTGQLTPDRRRLVLPPNPAVRMIDLDRNPFLKQKRYFQLFSDLNHLVASASAPVSASSSTPALIPSTPALLDDLASFLSLFQHLNPQHRAVGTHVEFESDSWVTSFNLTIQLARLVRTFGESFARAQPAELARALGSLMRRLTRLAEHRAPPRPEGQGSTRPPGCHWVVLHPREAADIDWSPHEGFHVPSFSVANDEEGVSFHHPVAWLWSEVAKYATSAGRADGEEARLGRAEMSKMGLGRGVEQLFGLEWRDEDDAMSEEERAANFLRAVDEVLRTVVLVAQSRAGVWVRNGFSTRAQTLHYREYSLRENTYDQDLVFLQMALVTLDPDTVVASIVDRFDFATWLTYLSAPPTEADDEVDPKHPVYEPDQALAVLDEMLNLFITLLTDPVVVVPLSPSAALRRELIHYLALGPSVYSDLLRRVSDRFSDDPSIDRLLAEIARFKPPAGSNDQGTYSLRDELLAEVDPYFSRYTRNQREEADQVVRAWLRRTKRGQVPRGTDEPIVVPSPLGVTERTSGPFHTLPDVLAGRALPLVVLHALRVAQADRTFSEQVADQALQLALVMFVERPEAFLEFALEGVGASFEPGEAGKTMADALVAIEEDDRLKAVAGKAKWLLDRLVDAHGDRVAALRKSAAVEGEEQGADEAEKAAEAKRAAAKARQAAIMKQFQAAQSAFLQNVEDDEDDDDLDGDNEGETAMRDAIAALPHTNFGDCIVCQDELNHDQPFGILGLVQGSNLVRFAPTGEDSKPYQEETLGLPTSLDRDISHARPYGTASQKVPVSGFATDSGDGLARGFPQSTKAGILASSCGHMMHLACFERYLRSVEQRHHHQPTRCHPENLERREFVCPLCKSLGNVLLPAQVDAPAFLPYQGTYDPRGLAEWAVPTSDPIDEDDGDLSQYGDDFLARVDKLSLLNDLDHASSFKPWRATMALPMLLPSHFNEGEGRMMARLLQVITALKSEIGGPGSQVATLSKDVVGYTVATLEIASRGTAEPAWQLSEANLHLLMSFVGIMMDLAELMTQSVQSGRIAAVSTRARLGGVFAKGSKFEGIEFTTLDPLGSVIEAGVSMPSAFYLATSVAFYNALAQSFLGVCRLFHQSPSVAEWTGSTSSPEAEEYLELEAIRSFFPSSASPALFDQRSIGFRLTVGKHLHAQMLVFLRRCAILARVMLGEPSEESTDAFMDDEDHSEYSRLLTFLRVPPPKEVLNRGGPWTHPDVPTLRDHLDACRESIQSSILFPTSLAAALAQSSVEAFHPSALSRTRDPAIDRLLTSSVPDLEHPTIYELVGLPTQLDTLVAASLATKCARCKTVPGMPALCLLCGEMVCAQSFCCMSGEDEAAHGECNEHMWTCGGAVGIFYLVKRNAILYLSTDKGAFSTPPYLDSHGEVDVGRGRVRSQFPQYLHRGRYDELRKLWLTGTIPTFVARKLEASTDHGGWSTF
ncbi:hypothetical protein JCM10207_005593 [Rhodosporidiobolus poonsookiae]